MPATSRRTTRSRPSDGDGIRRFVRYTHIFSSAVRDILEQQLLREVGPEPLTPAQFHILKLISLHGDHQVGEVAHFLGVSAPAASQNVDKLERKGLVLRRPSTGDRRVTLLSVSPKGRRVIGVLERAERQRLDATLQEFSRKELDQLTGLLERFAMSLIRHSNHEDATCMRCAAYWDDHCPVVAVRKGACPYTRLRDATSLAKEP